MDKLLQYDEKKHLKNVLSDIDIIEFDGMGGNKIEITKMKLQKTNQEKVSGCGTAATKHPEQSLFIGFTK